FNSGPDLDRRRLGRTRSRGAAESTDNDNEMMRAHTLLIVTLLTACGGGHTARPAAPAPVSVDAALATLTPRQKVAQLVVPWLGGNYMALDDSAYQIATRWVDSLEVGGIIVSVGSPYDIAAKLNALQ